MSCNLNPLSGLSRNWLVDQVETSLIIFSFMKIEGGGEVRLSLGNYVRETAVYSEYWVYNQHMQTYISFNKREHVFGPVLTFFVPSMNQSLNN